MPALNITVKKYAILFHRWLGVAFCLLFALWFVSGIVLMYWTYPEITDREALARAPALSAAQVKLSPAQAFEKLQPADPPSRATLESLNARPIYRFSWNRDELGVWADTGELLEVTEPLARSVAMRFTGQTTPAHFEGRISEPDQWTIQNNITPHFPLFKYSWPNGEAGEEIYISSTTAEPVQHTTRASRIAAYFGAIPHWLYFTPLRRNGALWNRVVVWSSGIGTLMSVLGIIVGLWLYSPSQRYRFPDGRHSVPYAGQKRWHVILGLVFGLTVCTWAFSGMMSMEPFDLTWGRRMARVPGTLEDRLPLLTEFAARPPSDAIAAVPGFAPKRLELGSFNSQSLYIATATPSDTRIIPVTGPPREAFDRDTLGSRLLHSAKQDHFAETRLVTDFEAYYVDRHGQMPLPVLYYQLDDEAHSAFYVDPKTARIVARYGAGGRLNRWLYHGLHSIDLPLLYKYRPLWDIVVLALMLGGTALCVTSLVIAYRRLRRKALQITH